MKLRTEKSFRQQVYRDEPLPDVPPPELTAIQDRCCGQADALITILEEILHRYSYLPK